MTKIQTKIENAKTILHECIHAYLFVKAGNPATGVDFVKLLNTMYPTANEQHDFMYNQMIPVMMKVLAEIRDLVTYPAGRIEVEGLNMSGNSTTNIPWNWNEYYKFLSFSGLDEAYCFIQDYPNPSSQLDFLIRYVTRGHTWLDKK